MPFSVSVDHGLSDALAMQRLRASAESTGLELDEETERTGSIAHPLGIRGYYALEPGRVVVTVERWPFFVPEKTIREKLTAGLESALRAS